MNHLKNIAASVIALLICCGVVSAQLTNDPKIEVSLPRITGWADNQHYIQERHIPGIKIGEVIKVNINTGKSEPYSQKTAILPSVTVRNGNIYLHSGTDPVQLTSDEAADVNPCLSPDGKWVGFTRHNDLYAVELETMKEVRYTYDGSDVILNGYASWVYYEEIFGRETKYRAFWWSPDSRHIAFYRFDDSKVPVFPIYNSSGQQGYLEHTRYPKAGDNNPEVMFGVVAVESSEVVWAEFDSKEEQYFGTPFWRPDGSSVLVQWMPREQNNLKMYDVSPENGGKREIYDERQPTWINWITDLTWVEDGFLVTRDFEGWEQIYYHRNDGSLKRKLTTGDNWKTEIVKVDKKSQTVFYLSNGELSTRTDFYSVKMSGKGEKRLTFGEFTHSSILLSPDSKHFLTTYANSETPSRIALVNSGNGKTKMIADSKGSGFDDAGLSFPEMVWIETEDGFRLPGRVTWPSNMKEGEKYPVVIQVYGGPNAATVFDRWTSSRFLGKQDKDPVIRIAIDHRGSGHCGKEGMNYLHRNLGKWEMEDYISWVKWLRESPYVDPQRIMITGGSYGGYITAMALTYGSEYFQYGICKYPVIDWMLYDSHYTERYMDHPKDNPEGYRLSSVLTYADKYQTNGSAMLMIQHGTMDDNVHMQNSIQLIDVLQNLNKSFEFMLFPNERHGWVGVKLPYTSAETDRFMKRYLFR